MERIERAAAARRHAEPGSAESQAADGQLLATLDAVRAEHAALQETTRTVRTGLDRTIRRIEELLEN